MAWNNFLIHSPKPWITGISWSMAAHNLSVLEWMGAGWTRKETTLHARSQMKGFGTKWNGCTWFLDAFDCETPTSKVKVTIVGVLCPINPSIPSFIWAPVLTKYKGRGGTFSPKISLGSLNETLFWTYERESDDKLGIRIKTFVQFSILSKGGELWSCCSILCLFVNFLLNNLHVQKWCIRTGMCSKRYLYKKLCWILRLFK